MQNIPLDQFLNWVNDFIKMLHYDVVITAFAVIGVGMYLFNRVFRGGGRE